MSDMIPILHQVQEPSAEQSFNFLKGLDSRMEEVFGKIDKKYKVTTANLKDFSIMSMAIDNSKTLNNIYKNSLVQTDLLDKIYKGLVKEKPAYIPKEFDIPDIPKKKRKPSKQDSFDFGGEKESFFSVVKETLSELTKPIVEGFEKISPTITMGLLGPFSLITEPIKEAFGPFSFFNKKNFRPISSQVKKKDPAIYWLGDLLSEKLDMAKEKGLFGDLDLGPLGSIIKGALNLAPIAALAGTIVKSVFDGIWAAGQAENWGVSKVEAFMGGFLSGKGEGISGMISNGLLKGVMGASAGFLIGGPMGALAGGLIGMTLGGIFGYLGAENTAKIIHGLVEDFKSNPEKYTGILGALGGAALGGAVFGPVGAIVGGLLGAALGGLIGTILSEKPQSAKELLIMALNNPQVMAFGGAALGAGIGSFAGPVGLIVGALIGAAMSSVLGGIAANKISEQMINDIIEKNPEQLKAIAKKRKEQRPLNENEIALQQTFERALAVAPAPTWQKIFAYGNDDIRDYMMQLATPEQIQANVEQRGIGGELFKNREHMIAYAIDALFKNKPTDHTYKNYEELKRGVIQRLMEVNKNDYYPGFEKTDNGKYIAEGVAQWIYNGPTRKDARGNPLYKFHTGGISSAERLAILRKDEEVLSPTQSKMFNQQTFDKEMSFDLAQLNKTIENSFNGDSIVEKLVELIATIKNKPFNNVLQNSIMQSNDFNSLRLAYQG